MPSRIGLALALLTLLALARPARAFDEFVGARPLGTGGASRAWAVGDAGPLLNPSGMALSKAYNVEADYGFSSPRTDHYFHASVVDSTSAYNIAGGLYYTYHLNYPDGLPSGHGHEAGLALSFPLGDYLALGGTLKYFNLSGGQALNGHDGGITFDLGATIRPHPMVTLGAVGANIRDLQNGEAPKAIGYGVAVFPVASLLLVADGLTYLSDNYAGHKGTSVMGGGSFAFAERFEARVGGGYDAVSRNGYVSAGLSLSSSELGAIDLGFRQDVTRGDLGGGVSSTRATVLGVALRLFVPSNQPTEQAAPTPEPFTY
jgi:hypothetical protein